MKTFTGWEYVLIDLANAFGLDKKLFEERIDWAKANLHQLDVLVPQADNKPLFVKAMLAIRRMLRGEAVGHVVGLDACCSGIQVMSAMTGCITGATNTGLVDPNVRADAYTIQTQNMETVMGGQMHVERDDAKNALMTSFYGSKLQPKNIFGEGTEELAAFYEAAIITAPGAWELLQDLLASWQPYALMHRWVLPDGFDARIKVMQKKEARIEVDELDHATFTYEFYENVGAKKGLSNVANVVHSVDAYVLRCIHRRCNYDSKVVLDAHRHIYHALNFRGMMRCGHTQAMNPADRNQKVQHYIGLWQRSGMADVVILPYIDEDSVKEIPTKLLQALLEIIDSMLDHNPFPVITIHDEFKCHPNNMNHLRQHYINVFAEIADSSILSDILSQIHGTQGIFPKLSTNLSTLIRGSNYALS